MPAVFLKKRTHVGWPINNKYIKYIIVENDEEHARSAIGQIVNLHSLYHFSYSTVVW